MRPPSQTLTPALWPLRLFDCYSWTSWKSCPSQPLSLAQSSQGRRIRGAGRTIVPSYSSKHNRKIFTFKKPRITTRTLGFSDLRSYLPSKSESHFWVFLLKRKSHPFCSYLYVRSIARWLHYYILFYSIEQNQEVMRITFNPTVFKLELPTK